MNTLRLASAPGYLTLRARTAADLMAPDPVSIRADATVGEAAAFFTDRGISGAPVIDDAGRVVGVVTQTDLLLHDREGPAHVASAPGRRLPAGMHVEAGDPCPVADVMTPGVFSVSPETPVERVVAEMLAFKVHRLFVTDGGGTPVGVISLFDILRHLAP